MSGDPKSDSSKGEKTNNRVGIGTALGVAFGVAIDNIGVGIPLGIAIGAGLGVVFSAKKED